MIELISVRKSYTSRQGTFTAVDGLDLRIEEGEFFALLGPSGCGKTTTLRMIGGFDEPTSGQILLHGENVVGVPPHRRDVNTVFQSYALFPHMNVYDNVAFGLRRKSVDRNETARRVGEILELVQLGHKATNKPTQLSGGQQQRVALARALVNRPRALLLDEPLAALDLKLRQAMQLELKRIQREVGITFVFVTHDQNEALTMSDRLAVMNEGRIEQLGPPREVYECPRTRFVADFIGTSNLMTANAVSTRDATVTLACGTDEVLVATLPKDFSPIIGGDVEIAVRPEKIRLSVDRPDASLCRLRARVRDTVYLGTATQYTLVNDNGHELTVFAQNTSDADESFTSDTWVWASWRAEHSLALTSHPVANPAVAVS